MWMAVVWLGQAEGPLVVALGFVSPACTGFLGSYSLWIYALLNLDVVGRALDLPQGRVPCPPLGQEGEKWKGVWRDWEEGREWKFGLVFF